MAPPNIPGIPSTGVGSLSTLLKRLEAATSRLEDIAVAQQSAPQATSPVSSASALQPNQPLTGLGVGAVGSAVAAGGSPAVGARAEGPAQAQAEAQGPSVRAFEELREGAVAKFVSLSKELGGLIGEQVSNGCVDQWSGGQPLARHIPTESTNSPYYSLSSLTCSPQLSQPSRTTSPSPPPAPSCRPPLPPSPPRSAQPRRHSSPP